MSDKIRSITVLMHRDIIPLKTFPPLMIHPLRESLSPSALCRQAAMTSTAPLSRSELYIVHGPQKCMFAHVPRNDGDCAELRLVGFPEKQRSGNRFRSSCFLLYLSHSRDELPRSPWRTIDMSFQTLLQSIVA